MPCSYAPYLSRTSYRRGICSHARHATDPGKIALADGCLLVERIEAGQTYQTRLKPRRGPDRAVHFGHKKNRQ